ncbi:MAG: hypothetical protein K2Q01_08125 [Rickettsiales bacterium]|nr:hypothetical protein [Rickettsiales bacterium]
MVNLSQLKRQFDAQRKTQQPPITIIKNVGVPQTPQQTAVSSKLNSADKIANNFIKINAAVTALANTALTTQEIQTLQSSVATYLTEIDAISEQANFSTGSTAEGAFALFDLPQITTRIEPPLSFNQTVATAGQARINFTAQPVAGQTLRINGVTLTASATSNTGTNFRIGATLSDTLTNLVTNLSAQTSANLTRASFTKDGATGIIISARTAGDFGEEFVIDRGASTANPGFTVTGDLIGTNRFTLQGATQGAGSGGDVRVRVASAPANTLLSATVNTPAVVRLNFATSANVANGEFVRLDNGSGGTITFTFATALEGLPFNVAIGATQEESLQNLAEAINNYSARTSTDSDFTLRQLRFRQEGQALVGEARYNSNPIDGTLAAVEITETTAGTLTAATFSTATATGVLTDGISNKDFTGTIGGFSANFISSNRVQLSTTRGGSTYTGTVTNTATTTAATVRLSSTNGGYFDIQLAANGGIAVANQTAANTYASRVNAAFSNLEFSQSRTINLQNPSALNGASIALRATSFTGTVALQEATVTAASANSGQAAISLRINNELFTSQTGIGMVLGQGETLRFTSSTNPARVIEFRNTAPAVSLATAQDAQNFRGRLEQAFGFSVTVAPATQKILFGTQAAAANQAFRQTINSSTLIGGGQLGLTSTSQTADTALLQKAKARLGEIYNYLNTQLNVLNNNQSYTRYGSLTSFTNAAQLNILT